MAMNMNIKGAAIPFVIPGDPAYPMLTDEAFYWLFGSQEEKMTHDNCQMKVNMPVGVERQLVTTNRKATGCQDIPAANFDWPPWTGKHL